MSPVHLRDLGFQRQQPEDSEGLSRTRISGRGHLGHSGGWQAIEGNHTHSAIHIPIKQKPQIRGLEGYGSSSSAPPTPQRPFSMDHGQQEVQTGIELGRTWRRFTEDLSQRDRLQRPYGNHQRLESHQEVQTTGGEGKQDKGESSHYPSYRRTTDPDREYLDSFRLTRREDKDTRAKTKNHLQPKEDRVRTNDPEAVEFGERIIQILEVVVHKSRISSPINRNITPTQIEHNVVKPDSSLKSDSLWLKMSKYAEQTQKQFADLEASHERMKELTASMDNIGITLQE
ncbi:hypothetical protein O181_075169 [Austropuccinia psidii MF-1]|uniref:Uncharacterized protein n=1 Tax=Austropuccinia psidii MF-1 TaxID=1389203 RepID=A0A9Q3FA15_9BASI|nr:hypothetical protein [Austropuccinia psidii MF-1]